MPRPRQTPPASLVKAAADFASAERRLEQAILRARARGASWDTISAATGINRERLRRNYSRITP